MSLFQKYGHNAATGGRESGSAAIKHELFPPVLGCSHFEMSTINDARRALHGPTLY